MKFFIVFLLFFCGCMLYMVWPIHKEYKGEIIKKGYEANEGYYKHSGNPKYYVIMKVDSINKAIRVNVTIPC